MRPPRTIPHIFAYRVQPTAEMRRALPEPDGNWLMFHVAVRIGDI